MDAGWWGDDWQERSNASAVLRQLLSTGQALGVLAVQRRRSVGFVASAFVRATLVDKYLTAPHPGLAQALLRDRPSQHVLDHEAVVDGNAHAGLDVVILTYGIASDQDMETALVAAHLMRGWIDQYQGYRLHRVLFEVFGHTARRSVVDGPFSVVASFEAVPCASRPTSQVLIATRSIVLMRPSALWPLFAYDPPYLCFSAAEKDVLTLAISGVSDDIIGLYSPLSHRHRQVALARDLSASRAADARNVRQRRS